MLCDPWDHVHKHRHNNYIIDIISLLSMINRLNINWQLNHLSNEFYNKYFHSFLVSLKGSINFQYIAKLLITYKYPTLALYTNNNNNVFSLVVYYATI